MPTPGIAAKMGRPVGEVERQVVDLYRRLGVSNRAELAATWARSSAEPGSTAAIEGARARLVDRFRGDGVIGVDVFHDHRRPAVAEVWLRTTSDADRDRLRQQPNLASTVRAVLGAAGLSIDELEVGEVVVQSQETVDRDCRGDWFFATR